MAWLAASPFEPSLPTHCEPTNDFLLHFSATFHTCIPTPLAFISTTFGILSIIAWLFSQLPQIYKNWSISSTSGLSFFFLVEWFLGDLSNLLGAIFTHQATWQVAIGSYYVFVDLCLVSQWIWYEKLKHGRKMRKVWPRGGTGESGWSGGGMQTVFNRSGEQASAQNRPDGERRTAAKPQTIFRDPGFDKQSRREVEKPSPSLSATPSGNNIPRVGASSPLPSPSPRTVLLIACLIAIVQAAPATQPLGPPAGRAEFQPTALEYAGTILSWMSTLLYLGSRLPQLIKNWQRKSTAGLSPQLFVAAFCGNLFYSLALLTNPCVWYDFKPLGGSGWAGPRGSERSVWVAAALPFFLGAAGVLGLDASVGVQFMLYGESQGRIVVVEEGKGKGWRWRRVSGWMRGWVPSVSEGRSPERSPLLEGSERHADGHGTLR